MFKTVKDKKNKQVTWPKPPDKVRASCRQFGQPQSKTTMRYWKSLNSLSICLYDTGEQPHIFAQDSRYF